MGKQEGEGKTDDEEPVGPKKTEHCGDTRPVISGDELGIHVALFPRIHPRHRQQDTFLHTQPGKALRPEGAILRSDSGRRLL